ncbi:MAG: helix-turn-helix domain-containing protein [Christensenellales bacterium]|jgi:transcriptional regulator with XRE-family HTH domain
MNIGSKIKQLRVKYGLTQEELANRTELSKGFISQLERDLTSPSINTLIDILECLGVTLREFFSSGEEDEKIVFGAADVFVQEDADSGLSIQWLITSSQKNAMEPILVSLAPGGQTAVYDPHEGEEFGHVLAGAVSLCIGAKRYALKKGDSFYFKADAQHYIKNPGKREARILWVSSPPSF